MSKNNQVPQPDLMMILIRWSTAEISHRLQKKEE